MGLAGSARANTLSQADNLDVLRGHVKGEAVDLAYLDPPLQEQSGVQGPLPGAEREQVRIADLATGA